MFRKGFAWFSFSKKNMFRFGVHFACPSSKLKDPPHEMGADAARRRMAEWNQWITRPPLVRIDNLMMSFTAWLFESWTALYKTGLNLEQCQWWIYRMIYHSGLYLQASDNQKELQNQSQRKPCFRCNPQPIDFDCGPSTFEMISKESCPRFHACCMNRARKLSFKVFNRSFMSEFRVLPLPYLFCICLWGVWWTHAHAIPMRQRAADIKRMGVDKILWSHARRRTLLEAGYERSIKSQWIVRSVRTFLRTAPEFSSGQWCQLPTSAQEHVQAGNIDCHLPRRSILFVMALPWESQWTLSDVTRVGVVFAYIGSLAVSLLFMNVVLVGVS